MLLLSADRLTKTRGDRTLIHEASFALSEGEKIALVGVNGCGKTTLLLVLAGLEPPDGGAVVLNSEAKLSILEQEPRFDPDDTILSHIFRSPSPRVQLLRHYEDCCARLHSGGGEQAQRELSAVMEEMDRSGTWVYESEVRGVLAALGITDLTARMGDLSGGLRRKVSLAQVLLDDTNLLLLDEPTNHLDVDAILWLEDYLQKTRKAVLMVTHDRYFLDRVCGSILELHRSRIRRFEGNYASYLTRKAEEREAAERAEERIQSVLRTELEWLRRGPKARGTKSKDRLQRITGMLDRQKPEREEELELTATGRRLGKKVLEVEGITRSFDGRQILAPFSWTFRRGERIGLVGPNGSGKTTLLNLLTGRLEVDAGTIDRGEHTHFGYFDQLSSDLDPAQTVLGYVRRFGEQISLGENLTLSATAVLERFLFPSSLFQTPIGRLSGGERRRLTLMGVLLTSPNFLVLDEPTNDLDIRTLSVLEDFLSSFGGCLLLVSHDRYFLDRLVDSLFVFDGQGGVSAFIGSFSEYLSFRREEENRKEPEPVSAPPPRRRESTGKLTWKEQRELEALEAEIASLEEESSELERLFDSGETDSVRYAGWATRHAEIQSLLESRMTRWEELAERASG